MLTINSLAAADSVVIPTQPHYLSAKGLELLLRSVSKVKRQINPHLRIDGILMTMVMPRTNISKEITAKAQWNDESEIVCYHGFQSFKAGEVTPEQAHEVGVKLAEKMWGDRFQVIVATHLNTECLHNHFVVNSVSYVDGKHYHDNKKNLRLLRQRSDELCREYSLSVIEHPSGRKKPYALYQAEKNGLPTRDSVAWQAVDEAISKSFTLKDFDRQLSEMGYHINFDPNRKYWTIIGRGWQRPKRLYKLGEDYTNERITERIKENFYAVKFSRFAEPTKPVRIIRVKGTLKDAKKIGGLRGLYLHYCYKLGILPKKKQPNYARLHYLLKDDLMKMEAITNETTALCQHGKLSMSLTLQISRGTVMGLLSVEKIILARLSKGRD